MKKKSAKQNFFFFWLESAKLTLLELVMVINVAGHHIEWHWVSFPDSSYDPKILQ